MVPIDVSMTTTGLAAPGGFAGGHDGQCPQEKSQFHRKRSGDEGIMFIGYVFAKPRQRERSTPPLLAADGFDDDVFDWAVARVAPAWSSP